MKKILFICMSNSRRSRMAEAIFEKLSHSESESGGIDPHPIDPNVIIALKEIGINLIGKKSKKVSESMLEEADKIITFICDDKIPDSYKSKVENWEIGSRREVGKGQTERTLDQIRTMRDLIYNKVKELVERLKE